MIDNKYMYDNLYTEQFLEFAEKDYYRQGEPGVSEVENGVVLPLRKKMPDGPLMGIGGVLDQKGNYVMESAQIGKGDTADRFVGKYDYDPKTEIFYEETVIYIGAFPPHWGHFLIDMVYRFWYFDLCQEKYRIVYCSEKEEIAGVFLEFFQILGIKKERLLRITVPSRFQKIIIPHPAYMACDYYMQAYKRVFKCVIESVSKDSFPVYENVYLSRGHFGEAQGKEVGESGIEENFRQNGFYILYMEELSLKEQVFYISHAKKVAALSGTLCHNIVFAIPGTELIILNKTHIINTHQVLLDQMKEVRVTYIDVYREPYKTFPVSYGGGPFWVSSAGIETYFKEKGMYYMPEAKKVVFRNRLLYTKMCLGIKIYTLYEKTYYLVSRNKILITFLRKIRLAVCRKQGEDA